MRAFYPPRVRFHVVIPARFAASRFPGKVLVDLGGRSVLQRVYDVALQAGAASVTVAAADDAVFEHARAHGLIVARTGDHPTGTDRVAEVARARGWGLDERVVNLQADAPLLDPPTVRAVAAHIDAGVATASVPLDPAMQGDPNVVKVAGDPPVFSRSALPGARRHLGIYGARVGTLLRWASAPQSPDELAASLEQLRAMAIGLPIRVVPVPRGGPDVDVPADLRAAEAWLETEARRTQSKERRG